MRQVASKFIIVFLLQGVFVLLESILNYIFIYENPNSKYGQIVFQLKLNVFPIFGILIPSAFIVYTHYVNFKEDCTLIDENYSQY